LCIGGNFDGEEVLKLLQKYPALLDAAVQKLWITRSPVMIPLSPDRSIQISPNAQNSGVTVACIERQLSQKFK
jgi:hypothetical protein